MIAIGGGVTVVIMPCSPGEDLQEGEVGCVFIPGLTQGLDVGRREKFSEDVCVWSRGRSHH